MKTRLSMLLAPMIALAALLSPPVSPSPAAAAVQKVTGHIHGFVTEACADIVFVPVTLRNSAGVKVASTFSMANGYQFRSIAPGTYTVTASDGQRSASATVVVIGGQTTEADLSLPCDEPGVVGFP